MLLLGHMKSFCLHVSVLAGYTHLLCDCVPHFLEEEGARHGCLVEHLIKEGCATDEHAQCSAQDGPGCWEADHIVIFIFFPKNNSKRESKSISEAQVLESQA